MSIFQLEQDVKAEVQERADEIKDSVYPEDLLSELADSHIPIYYQELAECLVDDPSLAYVENPGLIDAFNGVYQIIQVAIYERLIQAAHEAYEAYENLPEDNDGQESEALLNVVYKICDPTNPCYREVTSF